MPDPSKVEKVAAWPTPTSIKAVQRFVGFTVTVSTIDFSQGRSRDELSQLQRDDPNIGPVIRALAIETKPDHNELKQFSLHTNRLFALWDQLTLQDLVLYRRFVSADGL